LLVDALNQLNLPDDVMLCAVGHLDNNILPDKIIHLGHISDERLMPLLYSAVDAVIIPSREDNLPNVMLEALACGVPVIGFPVGGIQEILDNPEVGILAKGRESEDLRSSIESFLYVPFQISRQVIRIFAEQNFNLVQQTERYLKIYSMLMNNIETR
jgi:glycosyltransferase involved in cell wall biosynthesis